MHQGGGFRENGDSCFTGSEPSYFSRNNDSGEISGQLLACLRRGSAGADDYLVHKRPIRVRHQAKQVLVL